jgi:hypothetical protein
MIIYFVSMKANQTYHVSLFSDFTELGLNWQKKSIKYQFGFSNTHLFFLMLGGERAVVN